MPPPTDRRLDADPDAAVAAETAPAEATPAEATPAEAAPAGAAPAEAAPAPRRKRPRPPEARHTPSDPAAGDGAPPPDRAMPVAVQPQDVPDAPDLDHPSLSFNRELSWLDFNARVAFQAVDERTPLFERIAFVGIAANNLDEFFRKRIGGLQRQIGAGVRELSPDGRTPREQLALALDAARDQHRRLLALWTDTLQPAAARAGLVVRTVESLSDAERARADAVFRDEVFPVLTPLAVDSGRPFPFISSGSLSLAFSLRHPARGTEHFARLKVPDTRSRWVRVDDGPAEGAREVHVVALEDVICANADALFRGMAVRSVHAFRVTRNADVGRSEEEAEDLLAMISEELRERRFAEVVRLEVAAGMPEPVRALLAREMGLAGPEDADEADGLLDLASLLRLPRPDRPEHRHLPWTPVVPVPLRHRAVDKDASVFAVLRRGDVLVHHPYESFATSTLRFLEEAADDPAVLAIKQTVYRTSDDSPVVEALMRAAEKGKQVAVLVELKARFDEANNISWAQRLERAGAHVAYGLVGLKTHAKTTLVVRQEAGQLRTYAHVGTGNYNPSTARLYTDFGLLTADEAIGRDLVHLFHTLTGYAPDQEYTTISVAPRDLRARFVELIRREAHHVREGRPGRIVAKMNALDDGGIIRELYRASQAGVEVDLVIRGHCRLRPGVPGVSDRIRVISIIGRFLEHSRIYFFGNGGDGETYIGSADWMRRNLDERVEVVVPVRDPKAEKRLLRTLRFALDDNRQAWDLGADGRYRLRYPAPGEPVRAFHETLMARARRRTEKDDAAWVF